MRREAPGPRELFTVLVRQKKPSRGCAALEARERGSVSARVELARAVGAEVHEHDRVAVVHRDGCAPAHDRGRFDELVGLAARVGGLEPSTAVAACIGAAPR